ncbi:MAG TPA: DNA polymerase I [Spirochaetia bacterium]|nr:DNA polymerase I [Spirochaetales bacterium]HRW25090.1 DNA polymerase I [Spirochaetia bacterium]
MEPLFLLDAYGIIYRSYFAFISKPLRNPRGENVSAVFGFYRSLFQLWDRYSPKAFAAVFDSRVPTFRHERFEAYKATRQKTPEDLHAQIPLVEEILGLLGVPMLRADRYEADDIIATIAARCRDEGRPCYIVSGDKDLLQLVGGTVRALRPDRDQGFALVGPAEVEAEWGVPPERILDYLSLTGDQSDNVPGVPGVGDKTALKLLTEFGSFDAIWERLAEVKPDGLRRKLEAGRDSAMLSKELITLAYDAPLPVSSLDELAVPSIDRDAASAAFMREGMRSLATRRVADGLDRLESAGELFAAAGAQPGTKPAQAAAPAAGDDRTTEGTVDEAAVSPTAARGLPESYGRPGTHELVVDEAALRRWVDSAERAGAFAFDCETDSLDEMRTMPVGFSIAVSPDSACYVPLAAPDAACLPADTVRRVVAPLLARADLVVVGQNLKFDMHVMENWGAPIHCAPWDTMVAAWLADPERASLGLESLGQSYLGFGGTPYAEVAPKGTPFSSVPVEKAAPYCAEDAYMTLRLKEALERELADNGQTELFAGVEMPVLSLLARMEREGILVDAASLEAFGRELDAELESVKAETFGLVGHEFNMNSPKQLQEILFVERKLSAGKKTKTGYSTDISVLEELAREDRVPELILRHRSLQKLKSTYVDALLALAADDPRIRTHFVQTGTATGRLSSRDPNLQNIPVREQEGRRIRKAFIAAPGKKLVSADYSQIELVVFAHLSGDPELRKAFIDGADVHRRTAALILGKTEDEVQQSERRAAKTINFGVIYGMGAFRLAQELGIPRGDAQRFIDAYFERYSGVASFIRDTVDAARRDGYVSTLLGRRRRIRAIDSRNANERQGAERVAVNTPIQGSAADIVKLAMLRVDAALRERFPAARILLQVHDELIIEAPEAEADAVAAAVSDAMTGAFALSVPLRVGVESAYSWGDMH